jgi:hypothetical protein
MVGYYQFVDNQTNTPTHISLLLTGIWGVETLRATSLHRASTILYFSRIFSPAPVFLQRRAIGVFA